MLSTSENNCSSINDFLVTQTLILEPINDITCQVFRAKRIIDQKLYRMYSYYLNNYWGNAFTNSEIKSLLSILNKIIPISKKFNSNILEFKDFFIDPKVNKLILITEYTNDTIYNNVIQKGIHINRYITEHTILNYIIDIASGLSVLHKNGIYNINLSSNNLFIFCSNIKLNPFSFLLNKNNNTNELVCPECAHNKEYTYKSDIWYLGLLIYEICCLNKMKRSSIENLNEMYGHIIKGNYKPIPNHYSKNISELIKMCLQFTPERRPTPEYIINYIRNVKAKIILNKKIIIFKLKKEINKTNDNKYKKLKNIKNINKFLLTEQNYNCNKKVIPRSKSMNIINQINIPEQNKKKQINYKNNHLNCIQKKKAKNYVIETANNLSFVNYKPRSFTPISINKDILNLNSVMKFCNLQSSNIITRINSTEINPLENKRYSIKG